MTDARLTRACGFKVGARHRYATLRDQHTPQKGNGLNTLLFLRPDHKRSSRVSRASDTGRRGGVFGRRSTSNQCRQHPDSHGGGGIGC